MNAHNTVFSAAAQRDMQFRRIVYRFCAS